MSPIIGVIASSISGHLTPPYDPSSFDALASVTVPSSNLASVTFAGIPSGYKHLQVRAVIRNSNANTWGQVFFTINGATGSYFRHLILADGSNTPGAYGYTSQTYASMGYIASNTATTSVYGSAILDIYDYASTTKNKTYRGLSGANNNGSLAYGGMVSGVYPALTPVQTLTFFPEAGDLIANTVFSLYGMK